MSSEETTCQSEVVEQPAKSKKLKIKKKKKLIIINDKQSQDGEIYMGKYKPYAYYTQSLRARLTNYRGKYKLYATRVLNETAIYTTSTSLGDVQIRRVPSMSSKREFVDLALERMNIFNVETAISEMPHTIKNTLDINTDALKGMESVISKQKEITDAFSIELNATREPGLTEEVVFISTAISWIKINAYRHKCYLQAYNNAKDIFRKASTTGTFPRLYEYKGVIFAWKDITFIGGYDSRVSAYLVNTDPTLYDKYQQHLIDIRTSCNEQRIMFSLDDYDYDTNPDFTRNIAEPCAMQTTNI